MLEGNWCELCTKRVEDARARFKQTKYCASCAKLKKKENSFSSWHAEDKKLYMREYMRRYRRKRPRLSTPYVRKHREMKRAAYAASARSVSAVYLSTTRCEAITGEQRKSPHEPVSARADFSMSKDV